MDSCTHVVHLSSGIIIQNDTPDFDYYLCILLANTVNLVLYFVFIETTPKQNVKIASPFSFSLPAILPPETHTHSAH